MAEAAIAAGKAFATWLAKEGVKQAIVKIALQVAATAVVAKLTTPNRRRPQGLLVQTDLSAESPRRLQVGKRLNGGVFGDWLTKGSINEDTWRIFYLGEGPMGNVTKIYADGRAVWSGTLTHGQEVTLTALDSRVKVKYFDGRPGQTADPALVAAGVGWTTNHVGTGIAYCVVYARFHDSKLNFPPDMSFESEGAKLYDRRKDTTAGGLGSHRLKEPATWELSTNPAVVLDHYLLGRFYSVSDEEPWFGVGLNPALVPYDDFSALANLCDEAVALKAGGTQKRYEMNGFIFADEVFRDVIRKICDHMNARPADFGGLISVIDGEARVPVITLDRSDAIDESVENYKPKSSFAQIVGGVEGRYQDPANNYQPTDYPRYTESAWRTQDGGETKYVTRDFDHEVNQERAERLASLFAKRSRRQATLTGIYPLKALVLEEGDWFTRTGGKFGAGKVFEVVGSPVLDVETMTVTVSAVEVDPDDSAWDEAGATDPSANPDPEPQAPTLAVPTLVVTALEVAAGATTLPGVRFRHDGYTADPSPSVQIELALDTGSGVPGDDRQVVNMLAGQQYGVLSGLLAATDYVARWKGRVGDLESDWSPWVAFTSTGAFAVGSASSVPWSGVTGAGRPADNADVTGDNEAASITGQGPGATAAGEDVLNSEITPRLVRDLPRVFMDHRDWTASISGAPESISSGSASDFVDLATGRVLRRTQTGTYYQKAVTPLISGDVFRLRAQGETITVPSDGDLIHQIVALALDENFNYIPGRVFPGIAHSISGAGAWSIEGEYSADDILTARPGAKFVRWGLELLRSSTNGEVHAKTFDVIAGLADSAITSAGQTANWPQVTGPGRPDDNADVTGDNEAASIMGQGPGATASANDVMNYAQVLRSASLISNWDFAIEDDEGKPAGFLTSEAINDRSQIEFMSAADVASAGFSGRGARIKGSPDPSAVYALPAFPVDDKAKYRLYVRHRSSAASSQGLFIRFEEKASSLTSGKTHVTGSAQAHGDVRDSFKTIVNNGALPGTSAVISSYVYAPTSGTRFASLAFYNWTAFSGDYEIDYVLLVAEGDYTRGADVTGDNEALSFTGQGALATRDNVDTAQIAINAISERDSDAPSGALGLNDATWTTVMTIASFPASGIGIKLSLSMTMFGGVFTPGSPGNLEYRIKRGSTVILGPIVAAAVYEQIDFGSGVIYNQKSAQIAQIFFDNPSSGTYTYTVEAKITTGTAYTPSRTVSERFFEADERKR